MRAAWISIVIIMTGCYMSHTNRTNVVSDVENGDHNGEIPLETADDMIGEAFDDVLTVDGVDVTESPCVDEDHDGHPSVECGGDDCNDSDPTIYPGAPDACNDGRDTNCDGLDPEHSLLGPPLLLLDHPHTTGNLYTALVWTGREYLFLWRIFSGEGIFMRQVDNVAKVVGDQVRIRDYENAFDVAWNGSRIGSVWGAGEEGSRRIMFQAFDRFGSPLTDEVAVITAADTGIDGSVIYGPRIVAAGEDFFVMWSERSGDGNGYDAHIARTNQNGSVVAGPASVGSYEGGDAPKLDMAWSGTVILPGWTSDISHDFIHETILYVRPFSWDAAPLGPRQMVTDQGAYGTLHQVLWTGEEFLSLYSAGHIFESDIQVFMSRLDSSGVEISQTALTPPVNSDYPYLSPAVWTGGHIVILRRQFADTTEQLNLSRYTLDGNLDGSAIVIPVSSRPNRLYLVSTGTVLAFIWSEEDESNYWVWMQRAVFCD